MGRGAQASPRPLRVRCCRSAGTGPVASPPPRARSSVAAAPRRLGVPLHSGMTRPQPHGHRDMANRQSWLQARGQITVARRGWLRAARCGSPAKSLDFDPECARGIVVIVMITVQQHRPGQPIDVGNHRLIVRHVRQCCSAGTSSGFLSISVLYLGIPERWRR